MDDPFHQQPLTSDEIALAKRLIAPTEAPVSNRSARDRKRLAKEARLILIRRNTRAEIFPPSMFSEVVWELLLALYVADAEGRHATIGALIQQIGAAPSSALRWFDYLVDQKLAQRRPHLTDARAVLAQITDLGRSRMDLYLSEALRKTA